MVNEYNTGASNQGISEFKMHAVVGNLLDASNPHQVTFSAPEFYDFDIAAVGAGWHHFPDPSYAAKQLAGRLKKGGVLLILDFISYGGSHDHHDHGHSHSQKQDEEGNGSEEHRHGGEEKADGHGDDEQMGNSATQTIMHMGFAEEDIKNMFEEAGVGVDFSFVVLEKKIVIESKGKSVGRTAFMAKGRKA